MTMTDTRNRRPRTTGELRLDRPAGPIVPPGPHPTDRVLAAEQEAINDQAAGAYDEITFLTIEGQLPYEDEVDTQTRVLQADAAQQQRDALLIAGAALRERVATGVDGRGLVRLKNDREQIGAVLDRHRCVRDDHAAVLRGETEDGSGRNRSGPVPLGRRPFWWQLRHLGPTVGIALLELVALYAVFAYVLAADNPNTVGDHPEIIATAISGATVIIFAPIVLGILLRGVHRNLEHRPLHTVGRVLFFVLLGAAWLAFVWLTAVARAAAFGANAGIRLGDSGADGSADGLTLTMFLLFTVLGLITMWHQSQHNWHEIEVVRLNAAEHVTSRRLADIDGELARVNARIADQTQVVEVDDAIWHDHSAVTLPAVGEQLKAHYRSELIRRMGNPVLTSALGTTGGSEHGAPAGVHVAAGER